MDVRRTLTLFFILMFGVLVQASAVCHVVTCSLPDDPPKCHHEAPDNPNPETCKEFAAAVASIHLDIALTETGEMLPALRLELLTSDRAESVANSPPPAFSILRI